MRERIEGAQGSCGHPGVKVGGACYLCCKHRAALVLPAIDPPATKEQRSFVGDLNGHRKGSSWRPADSLLALWAETQPHPIERTAEFGARSVPIPDRRGGRGRDRRVDGRAALGPIEHGGLV